MKKITIYSTPVCHFCHMAKEFLTEHNITFTDIDVSTDLESRKKIVEMTGQMGVPVIEIQEEGADPVVMVGFNERLLSETLQIV